MYPVNGNFKVHNKCQQQKNICILYYTLFQVNKQEEEHINIKLSLGANMQCKIKAWEVLEF